MTEISLSYVDFLQIATKEKNKDNPFFVTFLNKWDYVHKLYKSDKLAINVAQLLVDLFPILDAESGELGCPLPESVRRLSSSPPPIVNNPNIAQGKCAWEIISGKGTIDQRVGLILPDADRTEITIVGRRDTGPVRILSGIMIEPNNSVKVVSHRGVYKKV